MIDNLESLYVEAKSALKAGEYDRAAGLLTQIIAADENYKDASRLLAQAVKLKRRRWYNQPILWMVVAVVAVTGLGLWILPGWAAQTQPVENTSAPVMAMASSTVTSVPTVTPSSAPTAIPLAWKRVSLGQDFERDLVTALVVDPKDPDILLVNTKNAGMYKSVVSL